MPASISAVINIASERNMEDLREKIDGDGLQFFAEVCLKNVVKKRDWRLKHRKEIFRKFVTNADEALAMLVLENNVEIWFDLANRDSLDVKGDGRDNNVKDDNNSKSTEETRSITAYMTGGAKSDGTKRGWSKDGIKRYNELYRKVKSIHEKGEYEKMEEELRVRWRNTQIGDADVEIVEIEDAESFEEALNDFDYENLTMV